MNITVINGTEKHGITYRLKEMFLDKFRETANIEEFYLPRDCNGFCVGCTNCFEHGENHCKDADQVSKIKSSLLNADLIVMAAPVYVFHTTGAMKSLLDHLGHMWIVHRPEGAMFGKRAVIITQSLGAGTLSAARDIKDSLSWWGISKIMIYRGVIMDANIVWDKMSSKRREVLTSRMDKFTHKVCKIDFGKRARTSVITKFKFSIVRLMQKKVLSDGIPSIDAKHWQDNGWLDKARPWKAK